MATTSSTRRYVGAWPKIGIRPAIDGRRNGIRESLEDQTMAMAKSTAALLSARLQYPDGSPVKCVIAPNCIGGVAEAAEAADGQLDDGFPLRGHVVIGLGRQPAQATRHPREVP